jgi:DNA polymerase delta subunit 1
MLRDWNNGLDITGRIFVDMLHFISYNYTLKGDGAYKLGAVAQHFLQQNKEDIHFSMISQLQAGTPETRRQLAIYCAKVSKDVHPRFRCA